MAYENRTVQSSTANSLPTGTDPLVDNTASGDVQAIKVLDGTAGSTTPITGTTPSDSTTGTAGLWINGQIFVWDGTNWIRARGDATNGLDVDVTRSALPSGASTAANQSTIIGHLDGVESAIALLLAEATFTARVGEVQASPTANTVLARLKTIGDALSASLTIGGNVEVTNDSGNPLPVNGTVTASISSSTNAGAAAKTADYDSGAGTDTVTQFGIALPASGGAVAGGTSSNPLRTDPTGTTTQPVSASSLPLPTGAATAANQSTANTTLAAIQTAIEILDNIVSGSEAQVDVVGALPAGDNNIGNVDIVTVPADPFGANADAAVSAGATGSISAKLRRATQGLEDLKTAIVLAAGTNNIGDVDVLTLPALPAGNNNIGDVDAIQSGTWTVQPGNTQNTTPWLTSPLTFSVDVTLTRPSDTTTYAANDELTDTGGAIRTITGAARASGGYVRLLSVSCVCSANVTTKPQIVAYLFDTTSTPAADNAAFDAADSVMNTCVGILPFNVWYPGNDTSGAGGNAVSPYLGPPLEMKTAGSANLFLRTKMLNAYVPTSAEAFVFRFVFAQY